MRIILNESTISEGFSKEFSSFKELLNSAPKELKDRIMGAWRIKQRTDFHPEGNTLKHIMIVTKRAFSTYPNDKDMILAAFFHDIGKDEVYSTNPKTGNPTAFGHEKVSGGLVEKYKDWVKTMGGNPQRIKAIVDSHMRIKNMGEMNPKKKAELESNEYSPDFVKFRFIDSGGHSAIKTPSAIKALAQLFSKNGKLLYLVGGAVRDAFYGKTPKDFDVATDANPDEIVAILKRGGYEKIIPKGVSFGVVSVIIDGEEYEIATFREDGTYSDGRRPDSVRFSSIESDAKRRDLTINALYYDIIHDKIVDLVNGIEDIAHNRVNTVGEPQDRFQEDKIRKLRALRFAGINGAKLDPKIQKELERDNSLKGVSPERIRDEFIKGIVKAQDPRYYLGMVSQYGFFPQIFPGLEVDRNHLGKKDYLLVVAGLLRGNDPNSLQKKLDALKYTSKEAKEISTLVGLRGLAPDNAYEMKQKVLKATTPERAAYFLSNCTNVDKKTIRAFDRYRPSVRAEDVMANGIQGKAIGDKIRGLEAANFKKLL